MSLLNLVIFPFVVFIIGITTKRPEVTEVLGEDDLEKTVDLTLTETETIWLLDMPTILLSNETEEAKIVKDKNEKYQQVFSIIGLLLVKG